MVYIHENGFLILEIKRFVDNNILGLKNLSTICVYQKEKKKKDSWSESKIT